MRTMWVVIMLVVAVLAGAGVYWLSLATLPDDDDLEESGIRKGAGESLRRAASGMGNAVVRARAEVAGLQLAERLRSGLHHLGLAGGGADPPAPAADPADNGPAAQASAVATPASSRIQASSSTSVGGASIGAVLAPPVPPPNPAPPSPGPAGTSGPAAPGAEVASSATARALDDDPPWPEDMLYVPVVRDHPNAHTRLVGFLGILALVTVAGGVLALGVWQTVHLIARALEHVSGS